MASFIPKNPNQTMSVSNETTQGNTTHYDINRSISDPIKVCHSPTNRYYKGSEDIIKICNELESEGVIQFFIVGVVHPHGVGDVGRGFYWRAADFTGVRIHHESIR